MHAVCALKASISCLLLNVSLPGHPDIGCQPQGNSNSQKTHPPPLNVQRLPPRRGHVACLGRPLSRGGIGGTESRRATLAPLRTCSMHAAWSPCPLPVQLWDKRRTARRGGGGARNPQFAAHAPKLQAAGSPGYAPPPPCTHSAVAILYFSCCCSWVRMLLWWEWWEN
jgi:hypothetical protein